MFEEEICRVPHSQEDVIMTSPLSDVVCSLSYEFILLFRLLEIIVSILVICAFFDSNSLDSEYASVS